MLNFLNLDKITLAKYGQVLLASLFIFSGFQSLIGFPGFKGMVTGKGFPTWVAFLALAIKLGGGLLLALGIEEEIASFGLIIFTLIATLIFHNPFPQLGGKSSEMTTFLRNLSIIGGLMLVFSRV
jgi:putative oxidoreductase